VSRVLVTGAAGFLGSHLIDALIERGHEVVGVDNLRRGRLANIQTHLDSRKLDFHEVDIRDGDALKAVARRSEVVYHLAAQSTVLGATEDSNYSLSTNVAGTYNVLKAASEGGARRLVFASSREVYGEAREIPAQEDLPLLPKNLYGASKVAGEALCSTWQQTTGLECQILRFGNLYGPRDVDRVIPRWVESAYSGRELTLYGGHQILDFLWVDYAVEALLAGSDCPHDGPINVASGRPTSLPRLADSVVRVCRSKSKISLVEARGQEVRCFVADVQRMIRRLGVSPPDDPLLHLEELATTA
jgi:UDP-glucose 4-epimerase